MSPIARPRGPGGHRRAGPVPSCARQRLVDQNARRRSGGRRRTAAASPSVEGARAGDHAGRPRPELAGTAWSLLHRGRLEEGGQRQGRGRVPLDSRHQPHRQERVAAQLEEVFGDADAVEARAAPPRAAAMVSSVGVAGGTWSRSRRRSGGPARAGPGGPPCRSGSAATRPARRRRRAPCTPAAALRQARRDRRSWLRLCGPPRRPPAGDRRARPRGRSPTASRDLRGGRRARPRSRPARCGSRGS